MRAFHRDFHYLSLNNLNTDKVQVFKKQMFRALVTGRHFIKITPGVLSVLSLYEKGKGKE